MPTDTQDHCSNLNGIYNTAFDTRDSTRASAVGVYFHGGREGRELQELSVKLVKFNFDFSRHGRARGT